jgi:uncharacterized protein (DUF1697 family)
MQTYIALLRGINVSGQKLVKMDRLRSAFSQCGFENVRTYVQSGNVVFEAPRAPIATLTRQIEKEILAEFGFSVPVLVIPKADFEKVIERNPFSGEKGGIPSRLYVTFLSRTPVKARLNVLAAIPAGNDRFHYAKGAVYLSCPEGYGKAKLSNAAIERALEGVATTRNWKTVNELCRLAAN